MRLHLYRPFVCLYRRQPPMHHDAYRVAGPSWTSDARLQHALQISLVPLAAVSLFVASVCAYRGISVVTVAALLWLEFTPLLSPIRDYVANLGEKETLWVARPCEAVLILDQLRTVPSRGTRPVCSTRGNIYTAPQGYRPTMYPHVPYPSLDMAHTLHPRLDRVPPTIIAARLWPRLTRALSTMLPTSRPPLLAQTVSVHCMGQDMSSQSSRH